MRHNVNMKSARYDDVFSQISLGPYYLGTGPGAINDVNHLPAANSQRRSNFQANYQKTPNYYGSNNYNNSNPKRDNSYRQNYQQTNNSNSINPISNGINPLTVNREIQNLPPRFQKQIKQSNYNNDGNDRPMTNNYKSNDKSNYKHGQPFLKQNHYKQYNNSNSSNGKGINSLINDMNQAKFDDNGQSDSDSNRNVNVIVEIERMLLDYFKTTNAEEFIKYLKSTNINFDETLLLIMRVGIGKTEKDREQLHKLINKIKIDSVVSDSSFLSALKNLFCKISELEVETPRARSFVAAFVADSIIENVLSLKDIGELLDGGQHYPLFPLVLQNLHKSKDQGWLFDAFTESKINLINMLPENDRNKERMADILEDRNLTFLYPMLRIESDITKQITSDVPPTSLYRWLKDNVNVNLQSSPEFISVVFSTLLKHIISKFTNADNPNNFTASLFTSQESEFSKYQQILSVFLTEKHDLQLVVLYSLQTYCHELDFPKGLIEKWFNMLYEYEIVDEEVFFKWREDINDAYPGKGQALFRVNKWLTWLEEDDDDEEEEE